MKLSNKLEKKEYNDFIINIKYILEEARNQVYRAVNIILLETYWKIGKQIVDYERKNKKSTGHGSKLFEDIAKDLKEKYGKGFSRGNVIYMRLLFIKYPIGQTLSNQLSWSHYRELLNIHDDLERSFYEKQCISEKWSVRELKRQISSSLFQRLCSNKDKKDILKLAKKGQLIEKSQDIIKDPYILEFLKIPENYRYSEKDLEDKIISNLQMFLLELGKGFSFISRQFRITINNKHFYVDLVFYHRILKCFVLIDLKIGKVNHQNIGQMNMYLNYFKRKENNLEDREPIGIILAAEKDHIEVEYALGSISNKLFVSKYKLYLPKKKELEKRINVLL